LEKVLSRLSDTDLGALRKKIRETKGNVGRRSKSKKKLEILENWYNLLLKKFGKDFDRRSKASFDKVGQTNYTQSQAGDGEGQQISEVPAYLNKEDDALLPA
jgi:hypothetical protein